MSEPRCVIQALLLLGMSGVNPICLKADAQASVTGPLSSSTSSSVGDWPQWRGPNRDGLSHTTGLLKRWPAGGPPVAWIARDLGGGYGAPSVANGRVYCLGDRGDRNTFHPRECLSALDESTGNLLWRTQVGQTNVSFLPEGSSSTPTVDGDHVYALGARGDLVCADVTTGGIIWKLNLISDFGGGVPGYSYCESPLVDEDKVVVTPGGGTATIVALDKNRGTELWRCGVPGTRSDQYSSVIAAVVDGKRVYVQNLDTAAVGISAEDGKLLWSYKTGGRVIPTAICQSNLVFVPDRFSFALLRQSCAGTSVTCQIVRSRFYIVREW
jgi:outer membrane protein assembly factor BamB